MAQVSVEINGRNYRMACDDGEEEHVADLGARLDACVDDLRASFGEIGDQRLTVMAAMMMTDQLAEAERKLEEFGSEIERLQQSDQTSTAHIEQQEQKLVLKVEEAAERIEALAKGLNQLSHEEQS
ncbi:MAG: cell division protein ZapA [Stappiaceae bacterium]